MQLPGRREAASAQLQKGDDRVSWEEETIPGDAVQKGALAGLPGGRRRQSQDGPVWGLTSRVPLVSPQPQPSYPAGRAHHIYGRDAETPFAFYKNKRNLDSSQDKGGSLHRAELGPQFDALVKAATGGVGAQQEGVGASKGTGRQQLCVWGGGYTHPADDAGEGGAQS